MKPRSVRALIVIASVVLLTRAGAAQLSDTFTNWIQHPAIAYQSRAAADPVARLNQELKAGRVALTFDGPSGYLRSTLDALTIPIESQVALFNRDSLQNQLISSVNPRTIYFNDAVTVAFVRGGFIEVASQDPQLGAVFYVLDNVAVDRPQFTRRQDCLNCHYSYSTVGIPGMLDQATGIVRVDHRTPLEDRWGGWYVTGQASVLHHRGNRVVARTADAPLPSSSVWPSLDVKVDTTGYLSSHSDIVALLMFDHQMRGMNLIGRIGWEASVAEFMKREPAFRLPKGVADDEPVALDAAARELVDYFLFVDEAPFAQAVRGSSGFAERFAAEGPRDHAGRSLRQLDLNTRLLRYPCSYLIYTEAFAALPAAARSAIYQRLWHVLSGEEKDPRYGRLSPDDRHAIIEILDDTQTGWRSSSE
jgi:hypothetical protein